MASNTSSQQSHVVQAIVDSVTRCFSPLDDESPFASRCPPRHRSYGESSNKTTGRRGSSSTGGSSGSDASDNLKAQYDADRYIYRKLEIFRTTDAAIAAMGIDPRRARKQRSRSRGHRRDRSNRSANTLIDSLDDASDEIANLTKNHNRGQPGRAGGDAPKEGPIAGLFRLLTDPLSCLGEAHKPFGICLGTPVRTTAKEDVANLSDWKLTAEEFAARQLQQGAKFRCGKFAYVPDVDESSLSHGEDEDEEETITSASYFDAKYSHIPETSPPMPLYQEQRISVSELETEELFKVVKGRSPQSTNDRKGSPTDQIVVKARGSGRKGRYNGTTRKDRGQYDAAPMAKSSSVSTEPEESHRRNSSVFREPDIVHATAAGI